jgi:arginine exporter protein ArgO
MLGYWPYATHKKNIFYIFFVKNTNITFNHNKKSHVNQILKTLINQLLNPKKYIETCSYIFTGNKTEFYLSSRYLII